MSAGTNRGGAGGILVRVELADGTTKWRNVTDLDHLTLCKAFGLDEHRTQFDVPRSFTGGSGRGTRRIDGVVLRFEQPIGHITLVEPGEKFKDEDPREQWRRLGIEQPEPMADAWRGHPGFSPG